MRQFTSRHRQRGYAAIPYIVSFFTASGTAGAAATAGSTAAAAAGGTAAAAGTAAGVSTGLAAAGAAGAAAYTGLAAYGASKLIGQPKQPTIPGVPTIDQAAQQRQIQDRILRRRGVLANIYAGGSTGGAPTVGTAKLLGQ